MHSAISYVKAQHKLYESDMKDPNHLALQILQASKHSRVEIFLQDFKEEKSLWLYQNCYINFEIVVSVQLLAIVSQMRTNQPMKPTMTEF